MKSLADLCRELNVHYQTIWDWTKDGNLPKPEIAFGKRRFYTAEQAEKIKNNPWVVRLQEKNKSK